MTVDARVRAAVALGALTVLGAAAGGLLGAVPAPTRVLLVLACAWVVPAFLLLPLLRRVVDGAAAFAFFLTLSMHAIVSESFRLAGASFPTYAGGLTWILLACFGATALVSLRSGRGARIPSLRARYWVAGAGVAALVAIAAWSRGPFTVQEDAFDHIGYVGRIIDFNSMRPDGVLAMPHDATRSLPPDLRKGALHPCIAWVATTANADPALVWSLLSWVLYPAFVLAFVAFTRSVASTRGVVAAAIALFMLSYGGSAFQLAHAAAYGQNLAAAWYWVLAAAVLSGRGRMRAGSLVLAFGGTLAHVGVAVHVGILAATLVVFARWLRIGFRAAGLTASMLLAGVVAGLAVRGALTAAPADAMHAHVQGVLFVGERLFVVSPMEILRQYGMCFLGSLVLIPLVPWVARTRGDARAALALCALPVAIAFVPPLTTALFAKGTYMVSRALLNAPVFAAAALVLGWIFERAWRGGIAAKGLAAVVLAAWTIVFLSPSLDTTRADLTRRAAPVDDPARTLALAIPPGTSVVLSDPATSYAMSAVSAYQFVAIYQQHANPRDPYALERLQAVRDVLSPFADASRATAACRRFGVNYVVVNGRSPAGARDFMEEWDPALFAATLARLRGIGLPFHERVTMPDYSVFELLTTPAEGARAPEPLPAPVVVDSTPLAGCTVVAPERAFEVTGVDVAPNAAAPGDSIRITLGYRRDEATPFGLPFLIHIRFDHESIAGARAYPGEKYVRRFDERRRGVTTRFRADVQPGAGVFDPDLWPIGAPLVERVAFVVPAHALPGRYLVEVGVVRDSLLPNFHARDLVFNRDHYSGTACATFDVRARESR